MDRCPECFAKYNRITPMLKPRECLENHFQYICSTCGRCICINADSKRGLHRFDFPFKSLGIAINYLRAADVYHGQNCGVYEFNNNKGRVFYKIFADSYSLNEYVLKNNGTKYTSIKPLFMGKEYFNYKENQIRMLDFAEIETYLKEQSQ